METEEIQEPVKTRPYLLSVLCVALFVYSTTISLIFIIALIFKSWLTSVVSDYYSGHELTSDNILLFSIAGLIIHFSLFISTLLTWQLKRLGYVIMMLNLLVLVLLPVFFGFGSWLSVIVYTVIAGFFSIFYRHYSWR